jgi:hypothetical protein
MTLQGLQKLNGAGRFGNEHPHVGSLLYCILADRMARLEKKGAQTAGPHALQKGETS